MIPIDLREYESAEPATCGSCKHFQRPRGMNTGRGNCCFRFPPWIKFLHRTASETDKNGVETFENSDDPTMVRDAETCSFWTASGFTYTKQRTWTVDK